MANALIIKSGGGGLTVKSGGTFTVKDSGQPPYVIDGLEQSHWDVANAVVTGGLVDSIPDSSNVQALTPLTAVAGLVPVKASYSATGWQLNGKTLPSAIFTQGNTNVNRFCVYSSSAWATKINNYTGTMTVAMIAQPIDYLSAVSFGSPWGWGNNIPDQEDSQSGPCNDGGTGSWRFIRYNRTPPNWDELRFRSGPRTGTPAIWMVEYKNATPVTMSSVRFWVNGSLQTNSFAEGSAKTLNNTAFFTVGGNKREAGAGNFDYFNMNMAQAHIWKGALTDQQRTDVTAYLKSISGIA